MDKFVPEDFGQTAAMMAVIHTSPEDDPKMAEKLEAAQVQCLHAAVEILGGEEAPELKKSIARYLLTRKQEGAEMEAEKERVKAVINAVPKLLQPVAFFGFVVGDMARMADTFIRGPKDGSSLAQYQELTDKLLSLREQHMRSE